MPAGAQTDILLQSVALTALCAASLFVAACATGSGSQFSAADASKCPLYKSALDNADTQGINALALKEKNGTKLTPEQQQQVAAYNESLAGYLKSSCGTVRNKAS